MVRKYKIFTAIPNISYLKLLKRQLSHYKSHYTYFYFYDF